MMKKIGRNRARDEIKPITELQVIRLLVFLQDLDSNTGGICLQ